MPSYVTAVIWEEILVLVLVAVLDLVYFVILLVMVLILLIALIVKHDAQFKAGYLLLHADGELSDIWISIRSNPRTAINSKQNLQ